MGLIPSFVHEYQPGSIHYGRNCIGDVTRELRRHDVERALIVCGSNVGSNTAVIEPLEQHIGGRYAGIFSQATPEKRIQTALDGVDRMRADGIDAVVGVGGGSSLDLTKAMCGLETDDQSTDELAAEIEKRGWFNVRSDPAVFIAVPTTLAGADLSMGCSPRFPKERPRTPPGEGEHRTVSISDPTLMPDAIFYDPNLYETTPDPILAGSAMNGFDKAIEKLYSSNANPISDATALRALGILRSCLPHLLDSSDRILEKSIVGIILAQYAWYTTDSTKISVIHAFGHGFSRHFPIQQGIAHGIVVPHVLRYLFDNVDGRRELLADGLGISEEQDELASQIIDAVEKTRDGLGLPTHLRDIDGLNRKHLPDIAGAILDDSGMDRAPTGLDPDMDAVESVLNRAW